MSLQLRKLWSKLQSSYWFVPAVLAALSVVLAVVTTSFDRSLDAQWLDRLGLTLLNEPEGARAVLSTIAGSMITVAGVTFSITIAAVVHATSQFGPRLLSTFMRDRGNQITLGTFIAAFLYCLLVLRTIHTDGSTTFVPHTAMILAMGFALASTTVLIYFIHHVPESIHASNVAAHIGRDLNDRINHIYPEMIGLAPPSEEGYDPENDVPEAFFEGAKAVRATGTGYMQYVDETRLMRAAKDHNLVLRLRYRPGDFVAPGKPLLFAWPEEHVTDEAAARISGSFAWGRLRNSDQNLLFLVDQLVEVSARALSPSVNDPFTAITCMDWLATTLILVAGRDMPSMHRYDEGGHLRLIARPITFEAFVQRALDQMRPYVQTDINASLHMMKVIGDVLAEVEAEAHRALLKKAARRLLAGAEADLKNEPRLADLEDRFQVLDAMDEATTHVDRLSSEKEWLGGSS